MRIIIDIYNGRVAINVKKSKKMEVVPMNKALDIAYYLIALAGERGISNLKLQKMLYFIQKESIKKNGKLAFSDRIEAWQYGPVIPSVYYEFSIYGSLPITLIKEYTNENNIFYEVKTIIEEVFKKNVNRDVWEMVDETHIQGSAWEKAFNRGYREEITYQDIYGEELKNGN